MTASTRPDLTNTSSGATNSATRRTLRLLADIDAARGAGAQVLLTGAPVADLFVDPGGRALWLPDLIRSYCRDRQFGFVSYRLGEGAVSHPTLPRGGSVALTQVDAIAHPTEAVAGLIEDLRTFAAPGVLLFDYTDTVFPADGSNLPLNVALLLEHIQALTADVAGWQRPGLQLLLVDRGGGVPSRLTNQAGIRTIHVDPPDAAEMTMFMERATTAKAAAPLRLADTLTSHRAGHLAAGLQLRDVNELRTSSATRPIAAEDLAELKGRVIHHQSRGTLDLLDSAISFKADVAGMHALRLYLEDTVLIGLNTVRLLLAGPPGTGKTYSAQAVARMLGVPLVSFGQILGEMLGQAENNMRRALSILRALRPVALFMDEAEQGALGTRSSGGRTSSEAYLALRAMLFEFLGDTGDDNGISVIATTNVPSWIDPAAQSRFTVLPVLFASGPELGQILAIHARRTGVVLDGDMHGVMVDHTANGSVLSGRSAQRLVAKAHILARRGGRDAVTPDDITAALAVRIGNDWTPAAEFSTLTALTHSSDTDALPWVAAAQLGEDYPTPTYLARYLKPGGDLDTPAVHRRIDELDGTPGVYR